MSRPARIQVVDISDGAPTIGTATKPTSAPKKKKRKLTPAEEEEREKRRAKREAQRLRDRRYLRIAAAVLAVGIIAVAVFLGLRATAKPPPDLDPSKQLTASCRTFDAVAANGEEVQVTGVLRLLANTMHFPSRTMYGMDRNMTMGRDRFVLGFTGEADRIEPIQLDVFARNEAQIDVLYTWVGRRVRVTGDKYYCSIVLVPNGVSLVSDHADSMKEILIFALGRG